MILGMDWYSVLFKNKEHIVNGYINLPVFVGVLILSEVFFRYCKRKNVSFVTPSLNISIEDFQIRIRKGN